MGRRINLSGRDLKACPSITFKSIKGQSLESNIVAALGLEPHHPIMSKLWGLRDQNYRQEVINSIPKTPHLKD